MPYLLVRSKTPGVADQGLEAIAVSGDPVDHEAAIRAAAGRYPRAVQERVLRQHVVEPFVQVFIDPAGPVLADLVGELLAVAGRAPRVDRDHRIARRGEHLVVPAIVPLVVPGPLRSAVDQEDDRVFLARVESRRMEQPAVNLVAVGSRKREAFELGQVELRDQRGVVVGELGQARAVAARRCRPRRVPGPCDARRPSCPSWG